MNFVKEKTYIDIEFEASEESILILQAFQTKSFPSRQLRHFLIDSS